MTAKPINQEAHDKTLAAIMALVHALSWIARHGRIEATLELRVAEKLVGQTIEQLTGKEKEPQNE